MGGLSARVLREPPSGRSWLGFAGVDGWAGLGAAVDPAAFERVVDLDAVDVDAELALRAVPAEEEPAESGPRVDVAPEDLLPDEGPEPAEPADVPDPPGTVDSVLIIARTATDLRRAASLSALLPDAVHVLVCVEDAPESHGIALSAELGQLPRLSELKLRRAEGGWVLDVWLAEPVPAGRVLAIAARQVTWRRMPPAPRPLAALAGSSVAEWRPGDPGAVPMPLAGPLPVLGVTPAADVVLRVGAEGPAPAETPVPVADRAGLGTAGDADLAGPESVPPVDELSVNALGWRFGVRDVFATLAAGANGLVVTPPDGPPLRLRDSGAVTNRDTARLRLVRAVEVRWTGAEPVAMVRAVAGLAVAGIPLYSAPVPAAARRLLGPALAELLETATAETLRDDLRREEHSVRLRRAAVRTHGTRARWRQLGVLAGVPVPAPPPVSVILCTRRPDMVGFALRQVARQREIELELVLTLHGFTADIPEVAAALRGFERPLTVIEEDSTTIFGMALNGAVRRAAGPLIAKMDDDDWYGPEHLADMAMARDYSGADVVGCGQDFVYLEEHDLTVWRRRGNEKLSRHIAGGTMMLDRSVLETIGGFRPIPRSIDTQLLLGVLDTGGRIYRSHGLGYVLRRRGDGHTWSEDNAFFLEGDTWRWQGFHPSTLLEPAEADRPVPTVTVPLPDTVPGGHPAPDGTPAKTAVPR
ncbi:glycosyltransferase [Allonocardiopsis opalescens]|uniref:Glycosyltransferase involved in cell wall biosynthesis n=1 Tax=Allonocardiopsis opalescens TaxID=1144618 RepID=A0A2T0Q049_9ACTN|nr:glycosyltransferase [Allonocardiopsis opalescens]PRX97158.1 glycosyltransferase involved in cell wall biosynthesis [Allonocardiopsis opalescens]